MRPIRPVCPNVSVCTGVYQSCVITIQMTPPTPPADRLVVPLLTPHQPTPALKSACFFHSIPSVFGCFDLVSFLWTWLRLRWVRPPPAASLIAPAPVQARSWILVTEPQYFSPEKLWWLQVRLYAMQSWLLYFFFCLPLFFGLSFLNGGLGVDRLLLGKLRLGPLQRPRGHSDYQ